MDGDEQRRLTELEWRTKVDFIYHSDRAAVDLGIAGLNAITLLNGGAVVALLAFVGQAWNDGKGATIVKALIDAGIPFGWGVAAGGASFFAAYFYQSTVTWGASLSVQALVNPSGAQGKGKLARWTFHLTKVLMLFTSAAAYTLFVWGVYRVSRAFLLLKAGG